MDDALPPADIPTHPSAPITNNTASSTTVGEGGETSSTEQYSTASTSGPQATDMDLPRTYDNNRPSTPKDAGGVSTFRGPGGSPILERSSPIIHRPYQSTSSIPDRRESNSLSPVLTRQDNNPNSLRMLPPPSPPAQRHPQYTGMDLPPLSSLTTGLPHRPPSSSMSIANMLGATSSSSGDMTMHSHHHHHPSHHHHHRPPRPYTPEYGNPLAPSSSSSNPLAPRAQSTPATPALGYPDTDAPGHGRSNSYGRLPTSQQGPLPAPFRDTMYRGYMGSRNPPLPPRDDYPPPRQQTESMAVDRPPSPQQPPPSQPHIPELQKPTPSSYSHQGKHAALNTGIPPPPAPSHHPHSQPPQRQERQEPPPPPTRTVTNGSTSRSTPHHHHRPASQPASTRLPTSRPPPKLHVNNAPALEAVANISPRPFLGRFVYEPGWIIPGGIIEDNVGGVFEIRIPRRFLDRDNEAVVKRKLWGTGVYTDDSDVVAILFHTSTLPQSPLSGPKDLAAQFLVLPTLKHYAPSTLNELRSRGWKIHDGYSIYLDHWEWIPLGSAEGGRHARKRRIDEEFRMGVDQDNTGVIATDAQDAATFKELNWKAENVIPTKRLRTGVVA